MKGVFSPPGTYIPGKKITLGVGNIRGVESRGMLVSEAEMELSDDHEGIIDLPDDAPVGEPYAKWAGLDDPVIEINLTPNRPDCTGVHGIARDLAAADMGKFIDPAPKPVKGAFPCPVAVKIEAPELCPGFALRLVRGVKNGAVARMAAEAAHRDRAAPDQRAGRHHQLHDLRPRPAAACVRCRQGARQSHRPARQARARACSRSTGAPISSTRRICVIADEKGVESLSGIMGGEETGCSADDHRRADRVGAVDAAQHRADRAQARHQFRCALPLRARRRSELHGAGPRTGDADGARFLRRHAVGDHASRARRTPTIA